ncbi:MAG: rhodanese-like domain-containing protein [Paracoccaceae bacterium]|nr:rhodanese-like domain-containing protein [Paracoccaceae bacterium]
MTTITTRELKALIDGGQPFHLIMTMDAPAFAKAHIPGSIQAASAGDLIEIRDPHALIVVYCTGRECRASGLAYEQLDHAGFRNIRHYTGGLAAWAEAGLPLESGEAH